MLLRTADTHIGAPSFWRARTAPAPRQRPQLVYGGGGDRGRRGGRRDGVADRVVSKEGADILPQAEAEVRREHIRHHTQDSGNPFSPSAVDKNPPSFRYLF